MKPVRILQVATVMNRGGLETMLMNYYRQMDRSKIQFDFIVHRDEEGHYDQEIIALGGKIYRMPQIKPGNYSPYFKRLDLFFKEHPYYQVVHAHINENSSFILKAAKKAGVPCRIMHSHLSDLGLDIKLPFRMYARLAIKDNPSSYFACSKSAGKWLFGKRLADSGKVVVLNNAVDVKQFSFNSSTRDAIRAELAAGDRLVIGHIGRFNEQKNHDFLIDIFKAVHDKEPNSMLVLAGEGHLRPMIEKKIERLGLSEHVKLLGVRADVSDLLQGIDIFLFPSLFEGLPVVLIEAQAAGLSCVISDTITAETDVTGRLQFIGLKQPAEYWAEQMLSASREHADTAELLRKNGYDTSTMAKWLSDYYMDHVSESAFG
ncbi:glycosyltransferase family 1 protein [Paenibacillus sp. PL91]|uniref:glycosyltransferase family 1 protein n=1 Tax=Paenibacillus sp. PL91 TaxID=2729538 RepID=UPI00145F597C|nr:glycosyltransferase family 1 protein [Paenibacillus sp. PL91]MBC9203177.1 glycosyltransferase family 1 protein [Paenibacillus sp. PL91]